MDPLQHAAPYHRACPRAGVSPDCEACAVRSLSVCAALAPDELSELGRLAQPRCFRPRQTIAIEGEASTAVHNITGGVVRLYRMLDDGRRQVVGFLFPGDVLGIEMTPQVQLSAEAIGAATACRFDAAGFARLTTRKPRLLAKLHERARHELMVAHDHVVALGRRTAEERIGWFLARLRGRCMTENGHPSVVIELPMPRQDIADYVGLTIETVSRTFTRLARERVIAIEPHAIRILDAHRMEQLAT
ncbi:Crp/Fnr family transcriptional regulator [Pseudorhodoplanes sinuspersici]|nr:helix-turn-helix domain-containing protein [Pseudorhodoplanes sinuspersici]RKE70551.1 CRP/FNR family transcriptional regulator [Pseudorhodoplanes sinuspersici]